MKIEEKKYSTGYLIKAGDNHIELLKLDRRGYEFRLFRLHDVNNKVLLNSLRKRFYNFVYSQNCNIMSENSERDRLQSQFLADCGLVINRSRYCFEKALWRHKFIYNDIFTYRSVIETGLKDFYKVFRHSVRYPERTYVNFVKATDKLVKYYNSGGTIDNFQTVFLKRKPVGIIMPYKIYSTYPPKFNKRRVYGTLLQIALIPEERGIGYGRIIHSRGLMIMKEMGLKYYLGSTDTGNKAMLRVFRINNCRNTSTQNFYSIK